MSAVRSTENNDENVEHSDNLQAFQGCTPRFTASCAVGSTVGRDIRWTTKSKLEKLEKQESSIIEELAGFTLLAAEQLT